MKFLDILTFMNPLAPVFESRHAPFSHVLRTTLWHKIYTAYEFFWGYHPKSYSNIDERSQPHPSKVKKSSNRGRSYPFHLGLFDYLFLGLPTLFAYLDYRAINMMSKNDTLLFLGFFFLMVCIILSLPLRLLAIGLTLALSPMIASIHFLAWFLKGRSLQNTLLNCNVHTSGQGIALRDLLTRENCSLDNLLIEKTSSSRNPYSFRIYKYNESWVFSSYHDKVEIGKINFHMNTVADNTVPLAAVGVDAFMALNVGDIAEEFAAAGMLGRPGYFQ